jgi:hypothetical protein
MRCGALSRSVVRGTPVTMVPPRRQCRIGGVMNHLYPPDSRAPTSSAQAEAAGSAVGHDSCPALQSADRGSVSTLGTEIRGLSRHPAPVRTGCGPRQSVPYRSGCRAWCKRVDPGPGQGSDSLSVSIRPPPDVGGSGRVVRGRSGEESEDAARRLDPRGSESGAGCGPRSTAARRVRHVRVRTQAQ